MKATNYLFLKKNVRLYGMLGHLAPSAPFLIRAAGYM
jgi:hypothetical protein